MYYLLFVAVMLAMTVPGRLGAAEVSADRLEESLAGNQPFRRLFLDAMVVEESEGLARVFHSAEKYEGNPVVPRDKPWEGWGPYLYGTVMWDDGKLKMWYNCLGKGGGFACYAESRDGLKWEKPNLDIVDYEGSTANNIVGYNRQFHIPSVHKVRDPERSERAWAMYGYGREVGPHVAFSEDGLHWSVRSNDEALFKSSDVTNFFYDPYERRYVCTYKTANRRHRAVGVALSEGGLNWHKPVQGPVFGADDLDPDATQVYGMPVFPYQGMYIGLPWIYHSRFFKYGTYSPERMYEVEKGSPCTVDVQLSWSWNLISWTRTPEREPFIPLGPPGSWDCGMIYTARAPVIVDDKLHFYYGGFDKVHNDLKDIKGEIGLAILRLDGFCSMRADDKEGWLISRREVFRTPRVIINAKTGGDGYVAAELLDQHNNVIKGFSREDCVPFKGDSIRHALEWKTKAFPADTIDADKKVRFYLKNADLYSYLPEDIDTERDKGSRKEQ